MKTVELTQGHVALIDDEDWEIVSQYKWHVARKPAAMYAMTNPRLEGGKQITVLMHRLILSAPHGKQVDHIDHNGLNNQRANLRLVSNAQNRMNCRPRGKTGLKGVSHLPNGRFRSDISPNGKHITLGYFDDPIEAARAYDEAARSYFGEFARLNLA